MTSEAQPKVRRKKMKSILPDHLDVIEEASEEPSETEDYSIAHLSKANDLEGEDGSHYLPKAYSENNQNDPADVSKFPLTKETTVNTSGRKKRSINIPTEDGCEESSRETAKTEADDSTDGSNNSSGRDGQRSLVEENNLQLSQSVSSAESLDDGQHSESSEKEVSVNVWEASAHGSMLGNFFSYDGGFDDDENDDHKEEDEKSLASRSVYDENVIPWRLSPDKSFSDWVLKVINKTTNAIEIYHVHKNFLGVGSRRSEYFYKAFKAHDGQSPNVTELSFIDCAAIVLPSVLDYIYSDEDKLELTSNNALGIRYLAQFLGVKPLFKKVMDFIQKDLSLKTIVEYYVGSAQLGDKKIRSIASRHCARNIMKIDPSHALLGVMDPLFFSKIMTAQGIDEDKKKIHISVLLAEYFRLHEDKLDEETFLMLTNDEHLKIVHHTAALTLLEMEADIVIATNLKNYSTMTSLQEKCVKTLARKWKELSEKDPAATASVCRKLPAHVITELLLRSLKNAKDAVSKSRDDNSKRSDSSRTSPRSKDGEAPSSPQRVGSSPRRKSHENDNEDDDEPPPQRGLVQVSQGSKSFRHSSSKSHSSRPKGGSCRNLGGKSGRSLINDAKRKEDLEGKIARLELVLSVKDDELKKYKEEMEKFERLSNSHDGKLGKSGALSTPSVMPTVVDYPKEGYLLSTKMIGGKKFPIFYYKGETGN